MSEREQEKKVKPDDMASVEQSPVIKQLIQRREVARRIAFTVAQHTKLATDIGDRVGGYNLHINLSELWAILKLCETEPLAQEIARRFGLWCLEFEQVATASPPPTSTAPQLYPCANPMCKKTAERLQLMSMCMACECLYYCSTKCRTADLERHRNTDCTGSFDVGLRQTARLMRQDLDAWFDFLRKETPEHMRGQVLGLVVQSEETETPDKDGSGAQDDTLPRAELTLKKEAPKIRQTYYARWKQSLPIVGRFDRPTTPKPDADAVLLDAIHIALPFLSAADPAHQRLRATLMGKRNPDWSLRFLMQVIRETCNTMGRHMASGGPVAKNAIMVLNELAVLGLDERAYDQEEETKRLAKAAPPAKPNPTGTRGMYMRCACCTGPAEAPFELFTGDPTIVAKRMMEQEQKFLRAIVNGYLCGRTEDGSGTIGVCWITCSPLCSIRYTPALMTHIKFTYRLHPSTGRIELSTLVRPGLQGVFCVDPF
jgi:hypothetical protein